ncbi:glutathione peroxidase 7 [Protopterus annectens]|uniref:glutathione peroxidase 7 n=1 Tax=Protopterus annectens TaxID=7888 RepID=UPI001CFC43DE|nr:glutathione peroxidase 7 [Protopterus annectens]
MLLLVITLFLLNVSPSVQKQNDFYTFKVVNIRGKLVSLEKYRGSVSEEDTNSNHPFSLSYVPYIYTIKIDKVDRRVDNYVYFLFSPPEDASEKEPNWNFWKYLVNPDGKVVNAWGPSIPVEKVRPHVTELVRQLILKKKDEL